MPTQPALPLKPYELLIKILIWLFVLFVTLQLWEMNYPAADYRLTYSVPHLALVTVLFLLHLTACCWKIYAPGHGGRALLLQSLSLLLLLFLFPNGIVILLGVLWVAQLSETQRSDVQRSDAQRSDVQLSARAPLGWSLLFASLLPLGYFLQLPAEHAWFNVMLFALLNYFAIYVQQRMLAERQAKHAYAGLLRELHATQHLLGSTIQRQERLRIARDLHDVLGHHLTALSLQLEVAVELNGGTASITALAKPLQKARTIAGNLLQQVRQTVSVSRNDSPLDLRGALTELLVDLAPLHVQLHVAADLQLSDPRLAELMLRLTQEAITNVLKHSQATRCQVQLLKQAGQYQLSIRDNGPLRRPWVAGNGLTGMMERVQAVGGRIEFGYRQPDTDTDTDTAGGCLLVSIPELAAAPAPAFAWLPAAGQEQ